MILRRATPKHADVSVWSLCSSYPNASKTKCHSWSANSLQCYHSSTSRIARKTGLTRSPCWIWSSQRALGATLIITELLSCLFHRSTCSSTLINWWFQNWLHRNKSTTFQLLRLRVWSLFTSSGTSCPTSTCQTWSVWLPSTLSRRSKSIRATVPHVSKSFWRARDLTDKAQ